MGHLVDLPFFNQFLNFSSEMESGNISPLLINCQLRNSKILKLLITLLHSTRCKFFLDNDVVFTVKIDVLTTLGIQHEDRPEKICVWRGLVYTYYGQKSFRKWHVLDVVFSSVFSNRKLLLKIDLFSLWWCIILKLNFC